MLIKFIYGKIFIILKIGKVVVLISSLNFK
jgi:hypothetical protein